MDDREEKMKEILDRECYENWHAKRCQEYDNNLKRIRIPCWVCHRNIQLAKELFETSQSVMQL